MSSSASKLAATPRATHVLHYCCAVDVQVQKRITDLIRIIDGLLVDMQTQGSHWKGFLDKLAVMNMAHHQVLQLANKQQHSASEGSAAVHPGTGVVATRVESIVQRCL